MDLESILDQPLNLITIEDGLNLLYSYKGVLLPDLVDVTCDDEILELMDKYISTDLSKNSLLRKIFPITLFEVLFFVEKMCPALFFDGDSVDKFLDKNIALVKKLNKQNCEILNYLENDSDFPENDEYWCKIKERFLQYFETRREIFNGLKMYIEMIELAAKKI